MCVSLVEYEAKDDVCTLYAHFLGVVQPGRVRELSFYVNIVWLFFVVFVVVDGKKTLMHGSNFGCKIYQRVVAEDELWRVT